MKMIKRILIFLPLALFMWQCAGSVDTSRLQPQEHLNYALKLYEEGEYKEAKNEFESISLKYPGNAVNDDAQYYLGMTQFKQEKYILAAYEFSKLIQDLPASDFVSEAQFKLAESYYRLSPPYQLDQKYTEKAIEEFQAFIDFFPSDKKVEEAEEKIQELTGKLAQKEFSHAIIYDKLDYSKASIMYYDYVIQNYHDTEFASRALYRKIQVLLDNDRDQEAMSNIAKYLNRYPDHPRAEELSNLKDQLAAK
jgi:outer membrane protein assembly factor BamD